MRMKINATREQERTWKVVDPTKLFKVWFYEYVSRWGVQGNLKFVLKACYYYSLESFVLGLPHGGVLCFLSNYGKMNGWNYTISII